MSKKLVIYIVLYQKNKIGRFLVYVHIMYACDDAILIYGCTLWNNKKKSHTP